MKKALVILLSAFIVFCAGCESGPASSTDEKSGGTTEYTVYVATEGGVALSGVRVTAGCSTDGLIWTGVTDENGRVKFASDKENVFVKLSEAPSGYDINEKYPLSGAETRITLKTVLLDAGDLSNFTCTLGGVARNFTVTDVNGNTHQIASLLKDKKAVVLNFWFIHCGPCKSEFPYLQKAYEKFKDDIEVIAINPVDGTDKSISEYVQNLGLTFPTVKGEEGWNACMGLSAFPTTVVIDRYGTIAFYHRGAVYEEGVFEKVFAFFTADGYKQTAIRNINDI